MISCIDLIKIIFSLGELRVLGVLCVNLYFFIYLLY
jgi:hypothetical protein